MLPSPPLDALDPLDAAAAAALVAAWARVAPAILLVPAFGLGALPLAARLALGLVLAAVVAPAVGPPPGLAAAALAGSWATSLPALVPVVLEEAARGLPLALAAAVPLWAATMAGGVADLLRGASPGPASSPVPGVRGASSPLAALLGLLAVGAFARGGGPARLVEALARAPLPDHPLVSLVRDLTAGIELAVALATPLLAGSILLAVAGAVVRKAAAIPALAASALGPAARGLAVLCLVGLVLERVAMAVEASLP